MADISVGIVPSPQAQPIASYPYADIAAGIGITPFYGVVITSGDAAYPPNDQTSYYLTSNQPYSDNVIVSGAIIAAPDGGYVNNLNYDMIFNLPQNIKGKASLNISLGGFRTAGGSNPNIWVSGATIQNATTSTTLGTSVNSANLILTATGVNSQTMLMEFDLTSQVYHFKAGETLRLNLPIWGTGGSSSGLSYGGYGADPKDRDDPDSRTLAATTTSQMVLYLPFLLNNL